MTDEDFINLAHSVGVKTRTGAGAIAFGRALESRVRAAALEEAARIADGYVGANTEFIARDIRALASAT